MGILVLDMVTTAAILFAVASGLMIILGVMIAVSLELAGVSALPVAVGMYLPLGATTPIFIGGMVRQKNALGTLMQSFIVLALISIQWVLWGYSLAFGPDKGGIIGGLEWAGLRNVGQMPNPDYAATIPHQAFMLFQMMFAVITPALITGAFAERKKFSTFLVIEGRIEREDQVINVIGKRFRELKTREIIARSRDFH